jgi:integrase
MARPRNLLTVKQVEAAKPADKVVRLFDGGGLILEIRPSGQRAWHYKFKFDGRDRRMSLGPASTLSLAQARDLRDKAERQILKGENPIKARRVRREVAKARQQADANTFEAYARDWFDKVHAHKSESTTVRNERLLKYLNDDLGGKSISKITRPHVKECVLGIESTSGRETAHRALNLAQRIFESAATDDLIEHDPCYGVRGKLGEVTVRRRVALTKPAEVGKLLQAIWSYDGWPQTVAALKLLAMTFLRPGELRKLEWSEVDFGKRLIVLPVERTKKKRHEHLVPLADQAVAVLKELKKLRLNERYVFPTSRPDRPLSENAFSVALKTMGYGGDKHMPHGFRSTASTLLHEMNFDHDVIETQLDHSRPGVNGIYNRANHLRRRTQMMQAWANYLDRLRTDGKVMPIRSVAAR